MIIHDIPTIGTVARVCDIPFTMNAGDLGLLALRVGSGGAGYGYGRSNLLFGVISSWH